MKLRMSWLDLKLAGRMLSKYPGLTLVAGFSFAIAAAAMAFEFLTHLVYPSLPVPGGDRIVALRMWDAAASRPERRSLHEFMLWRDELRSVDDIGIFSVIERNLRWQDVAGEPVRGAAISEAAFRVAGVPAQLGRTLVAADEEVGAARARLSAAPGTVPGGRPAAACRQGRQRHRCASRRQHGNAVVARGARRLRAARRGNVPGRRAQQEADHVSLGGVREVQRDRFRAERLRPHEHRAPDPRPFRQHVGQRRIGRDERHTPRGYADRDLVGAEDRRNRRGRHDGCQRAGRCARAKTRRTVHGNAPQSSATTMPIDDECLRPAASSTVAVTM